MKLLLLDNYDSFTYNLVHLIEKVSDIEIEVFRNDEISIDEYFIASVYFIIAEILFPLSTICFLNL